MILELIRKSWCKKKKKKGKGGGLSSRKDEINIYKISVKNIQRRKKEAGRVSRRAGAGQLSITDLQVKYASWFSAGVLLVRYKCSIPYAFSVFSAFSSAKLPERQNAINKQCGMNFSEHISSPPPLTTHILAWLSCKMAYRPCCRSLASLLSRIPAALMHAQQHWHGCTASAVMCTAGKPWMALSVLSGTWCFIYSCQLANSSQMFVAKSEWERKIAISFGTENSNNPPPEQAGSARARAIFSTLRHY